MLLEWLIFAASAWGESRFSRFPPKTHFYHINYRSRLEVQQMGPVLPLNWSQSLAMNLPPQGALLWKMFSRWVWQFGFLWRTYKQSPCAGGYGRRLTFRRLWGRIPAPYTGWKIFTYICVVKIVMFGKTKMNKKRLGMAHFLKKQFPFYKRGFRVLSKRKNVAK